jgi:hypothetical protein
MMMNLHEIITTLGLLMPCAYALGRFDEKRCADDITISIGFFTGVAAAISAGVAITIRCLG